MSTPRQASLSPAVRSERKWRKLFLLLHAVAALATFEIFGAEMLIFALLLLAMMRLSAPYAAAALVASTMASILDGGLTSTYLNYYRWILVFGGSAAIMWRLGRRQTGGAPRFSLFYSMMAAFAFAAVLSAVSSRVPGLALSKAIPLVALVFGCGAAARALTTECGPLAPRLFVNASLWMLAPYMFLSLLSFYLGAAPTVGPSYLQGYFRGMAGNPNSFGAGFAFVLPLMFAGFAAQHRVIRIVPAAIVALATAGVYLLLLSRSRAGLLAFGVAIAVLYLLHVRSKLSFLAVACVAAGGIWISYGPANALERVQNLVYKDRGASRGVLFSRLEPWQFARDTFLESPWVGIGFGVTSEREVMIVEANQLRAVKIEQGSSFWAVLSQVGLAGFVPISIALFNVLGRGLYFAYKVRDPYFSVLVASACGAMVNSIFEGWMVSPGSGLLWFTMMNCFVIDAVTSEFRPPAKRRRAAPAIQTIVPRPRALTPAQSATSRML